jgi:hypothetical protein
MERKRGVSGKGTENEKMASWNEFLKNVPVGSLVENTYLDKEDGSLFRANTAPGGYYEDFTSKQLNVVNIDGVEGTKGVWTVGFVQKAKKRH